MVIVIVTIAVLLYICVALFGIALCKTAARADEEHERSTELRRDRLP